MSRGARPAERGLTLIEMVLTLTILAVAGSLVFGALSTALRAWQGGFARGRDELVARIVLERLAGQLRSVVVAPARRGNEDVIAFDAGEHALRFVTLLGSGRAPAQVSYAIAEEEGASALVYREYPWPDKDFFSAGKPRREERVPEITGLTVTLTRRPDEENATGDQLEGPWSPADGVLPGTVTVEITATQGGDAGPAAYSLTVPLETVGAQ